jgi:deoxyribodipyrimidine photolyase
MRDRPTIVLFTRDLRVHDHPGLASPHFGSWSLGKATK